MKELITQLRSYVVGDEFKLSTGCPYIWNVKVLEKDKFDVSFGDDYFTMRVTDDTITGGVFRRGIYWETTYMENFDKWEIVK